MTCTVPSSDDGLRLLTTKIDSLVIGAADQPEMHRKLNTLTRNGSPNWQLLRSPWWVGGRLIAVVIKPSKGQRAMSYDVERDAYAYIFLNEAADALRQIDMRQVERMAKELARVRDAQGRLFLLGNGGGAGHASHAACDFRKLCQFEAYCPSDNVSWLTAHINDHDWDEAYAAWLASNNLRSNDGVLVFSVGGGDTMQDVSTNLIEAVKFAKPRMAWIGALVGRDGGEIGRIANDIVLLPCRNPKHTTLITEGLQAVVWHLLVGHPLLAKESPKWESLASS